MLSSPRTTCPACYQAAARFLPTASHLTDVDYFMCALCHHIWNVPKGLQGPVRHVTRPASETEKLK